MKNICLYPAEGAIALSSEEIKQAVAESVSAYAGSGKKVLLIKPQTYMNNSGETVREALAFYKRGIEQRKKSGGKQVLDSDWVMADRIAPIWPEEAIAIWERIIQNSTDAWQGDYDNIVRALKCIKSILFILGRAKEFRARVRSMIESNKRRRNLVNALEEL